MDDKYSCHKISLITKMFYERKLVKTGVHILFMVILSLKINFTPKMRICIPGNFAFRRATLHATLRAGILYF